MNDIEERLTNCFNAVLPKLQGEDLRNASIHSVSDWDSMVTITLMSLIEESFEVQTEPEDIEHLTSFNSILRYLEQKTAACNAD